MAKKKKNRNKAQAGNPELNQSTKPKEEEKEPITDQDQSDRIKEALEELPSAQETLAWFEVAETLFESNMFGSCKNPAGVFAVIMYGRELGLAPMTTLMNVSIIEGQPACSSQLMYALATKAGVKIKILERSIEQSEIEMSYQGMHEIFSFSEADVVRAGLAKKNNHVNYPIAMKFWRAVSDGLKVIAPAVTMKMYTFDELTNGQAMTMDEYKALPDPAGPPKQPYRRPKGKTTPKGDGKPKPASEASIAGIEEKLKTQMVPADLRQKITGWINQYRPEKNWPADGAGKAHTRLAPFQPRTGRSATEPATTKQFDMLHALLNNDSVPGAVREDIDFMAAGADEGRTKAIVSAWIETLKYYVDGNRNPDPEPPDNKPGKSVDDDLPFDENGKMVDPPAQAPEGGPAAIGQDDDDIDSVMIKRLAVTCGERILPEELQREILEYLAKPGEQDLDQTQTLIDTAEGFDEKPVKQSELKC